MKRLFFIFFLFLPIGSFAQVEFGTTKSFDFQFNNDVFFDTDRYYFNGFSLSYQFPKAINLFGKGDFVEQGFSFEHKIYTPSKFDKTTIDFDQPFNAAFTLAYSSKALKKFKKLRTTQHLQLGIQGRNSGGKTVQNFFHGLFPASEKVNDWQYQLGTDLILNYQLEVEKGLLTGQNFIVNGLGKVMIGTPELSTSIGANIRIGKLFDRFQFTDFANEDWTLFFYTKPLLKVVAYNTLIQGGLSTHDDPFTIDDINYLNYEIQTGIYFSKSHWAFDFSFTYQSPLAEQLSRHRWGSLSVGYLIN